MVVYTDLVCVYSGNGSATGSGVVAMQDEGFRLQAGLDDHAGFEQPEESLRVVGPKCPAQLVVRDRVGGVHCDKRNVRPRRQSGFDCHRRRTTSVPGCEASLEKPTHEGGSRPDDDRR